ncbi:glutamine--fructose-6-phosphate transaminase (isomerizing) [Candidatus Peregrinibacteria bacterium]|nr:glutamine--fructose-6-phosphate transaminase (isomerizing) [Candidatus Peregrinibacteria bacterium]
MCGIFGYVGKRADAGCIVVRGLKNLEYRGYDSWGVAYQVNGSILVKKDVGRISAVSADLFSNASNLALAHTRWATHGGVTQLNAHPHTNEDGTVAVVHNGIIENFQELKEDLLKRGHLFLSETDTEVIPHLIEEELRSSDDFALAVRKACMRFQGRFAILAMHTGSQTLVAARTGSPLIVGVSKETADHPQGYFIASDIPAFIEHTRLVQYIDDGEMVVTDGNSILFMDLKTGEERPKREVEIQWTIEQAQKGKYAHYMLKEIMEQKESIARAINQEEEEIETIAKAIRSARGTFLAASGTAHKACMAAEYFFSVIAEHHVNVVSACEFKLYHHFLKPESLLIVVSQSGETADVLEAIKIARSKGSKVLAIVNVQGSTIDREADYTLYINAGPERGVASTKALTGQMAVLMLIAYALKGALREGKQLLLDTVAQINDMLNPRYVERIEHLAEKIRQKNDLYIIGRGWNYPMALESAIKIKEVSYIHAEGFAGGELKHGPIALIEEGVPCVVLAGNDEVAVDIVSNALELKARGAYVIGVGPARRRPAFDEWIKVPDAGAAQPLVNIIPMQILAYFLAVQRGKDPDMPRNLAKSVTVK